MLNVNPWNIFFTILNLLVMYLGMRYLLYKPVLGIMEKRKAQMDKEKAEIEKLRQEAVSMQEEAQKRLDGIEEEGAAIIAVARNKAKDEADRITAEASFQSHLLIENTKRSCREEQEKARKDAESEIAKLAILAATKIAENAAAIKGDSAIYDDFLKKENEI